VLSDSFTVGLTKISGKFAINCIAEREFGLTKCKVYLLIASSQKEKNFNDRVIQKAGGHVSQIIMLDLPLGGTS